MNYLQVTIPLTGEVEGEVLIALLSEAGFEGFEEQQDLLLGFIREDQFSSAALEAHLAPWHIDYSLSSIPEKNWNEEWEKNFDPVIVDDFCAVRAPFHPPVKGVQHELVIMPKMSFGTGHHATTYMMMEAIRHLDLEGKRVLDFGTGTGVLAILAERSGAKEVTGIDNDDWSIENARENIAVNHCGHITILKSDTPAGLGKFDVILANINKNVILQHLSGMVQQLSTQGVILLSGLLESDFQEIEKQIIACDYSISKRIAKGNWICLKAERRGN